MKAPPPDAAAPAAAPGKPAVPAPGQPGAPVAGQPPATGPGAPPASGQALPAQAAGQGGSAQAASGQSGVAVESPKPNAAGPAPGSGQNAPQTSGTSAPVPTAATSTPKEKVMDVAAAEELARTNDIAKCRDASRKLRLAGVSMPPTLLALTALDMKFQQRQSPAAPAQPKP
jgi:hypothetical protein